MSNRERKCPPQCDRDSELKKTAIACIVQKLQKMNLGQLREVLDFTTKSVNRRK